MLPGPGAVLATRAAIHAETVALAASRPVGEVPLDDVRGHRSAHSLWAVALVDVLQRPRLVAVARGVLHAKILVPFAVVWRALLAVSVGVVVDALVDGVVRVVGVVALHALLAVRGALVE